MTRSDAIPGPLCEPGRDRLAEKFINARMEHRRTAAEVQRRIDTAADDSESSFWFSQQMTHTLAAVEDALQYRNEVAQMLAHSQPEHQIAALKEFLDIEPFQAERVLSLRLEDPVLLSWRLAHAVYAEIAHLERTAVTLMGEHASVKAAGPAYMAKRLRTLAAVWFGSDWQEQASNHAKRQMRIGA